MVYRRVRVKGAFTKSGLPEFDYSINPYFGCEFACVYCYARKYFLARGVEYEWGSYVEVKVNLPEVAAEELRRIPRGSSVGIGVSTDPYQPAEARERVTRRLLEAIAGRKGLEISIQTKSPLVLRDADLIASAPRVDVGFTVLTLDRGLARAIEPRAPSPRSRLRAAAALSRMGVETWVFIGPVLPYITDDEETIREVVEASCSAGVRRIYVDNLRFRPGVRESMLRFLREWDEGLYRKYATLGREGIARSYRAAVEVARRVAREWGVELENVGYPA